jgi:hypothetical protein
MSLDQIQAATGKDIALNLTDDGKFIVKGEMDGLTGLAKDVITFDSFGNVYFAGTLTADKIKANSIEGLEIWTNKTVADSPIATPSALLSSETPLKSIEIGSALANLNVEGLATVSGQLTAQRLHIKDSVIVEAILNVVDTITSSRLFVTELADFLCSVIFRKDVIFAGRPSFNADTTGVVVIKTGESETAVVFEKEYETTPIVNTSITFSDPCHPELDSGSIQYLFV